MSFDAAAIAAIAAELRASILGGRPQRVVQADELTFGIELYAQRQRRWLLLSADPQRARVHLVAERVGRAGELVSPLLLLLRKHLRAARLLRIEQPDFERVLALTFGPSRLESEPDEPGVADDGDDQAPGPADAGERAAVTLIIEAIGRYSNLILVDAAGLVLDSAKRVPAEINRYRVVLPRRPYVPPPSQAKQPLAGLAPADLAARLAAAPAATTAWQVLVGAYAGVSPQLAREAVFRAVGRTDGLASASPAEPVAAALRALLAPRETGAWQPSVALDGEQVIAFAPYLLTQHRVHRAVSSISAAIAAYYAGVERYRPVDQARGPALRALAVRREAASRKAESLQRALAGGQRAEALRRSGEAILAHLSELRRGQAQLAADGLEIELDPGLTPVENSQAYFRRYRKAKAALAGVPALIADTRLYLEYLDQAAVHLDLAETVDQVRAIQRELTGRDGGASGARPSAGEKRAGAKPGRRPRAAPSPLAGLGRYTSSDGVEILVGRTGRQNEALTFELARPDDVWLHARGVPGAHVVVRAGASALPERTLAEAARLAAYFSASRGATRVAVDWTHRRQVRRLREGLPGLVSYSGERTLQVPPELPGAAP